MLHFAHCVLSRSNLNGFAGVSAPEPAAEMRVAAQNQSLVQKQRGSNSVVESRLPKPLVAGSIPVSRSKPSPIEIL